MNTMVHNKTTLVLEARMKRLYYTFFYLSIYLTICKGCNDTQKSRFDTYLGFGVTVRYGFGRTSIYLSLSFCLSYYQSVYLWVLKVLKVLFLSKYFVIPVREKPNSEHLLLSETSLTWQCVFLSALNRTGLFWVRIVCPHPASFVLNNSSTPTSPAKIISQNSLTIAKAYQATMQWEIVKGIQNITISYRKHTVCAVRR